MWRWILRKLAWKLAYIFFPFLKALDFLGSVWFTAAVWLVKQVYDFTLWKMHQRRGGELYPRRGVELKPRRGPAL